jgi:hypothetical protein
VRPSHGVHRVVPTNGPTGVTHRELGHGAQTDGCRPASVCGTAMYGGGRRGTHATSRVFRDEIVSV